MSKTISSITVFFENPFWVGIYERECNGKYEVCKITFGAEPRDYEVYYYLLHNFTSLQFSPSIKTETIDEKRINPKRMQRAINKQLCNAEIGIKAQKALKLQHEQGKLEKISRSRKQKENEKEFQFELRQEKRKSKHRGH